MADSKPAPPQEEVERVSDPPAMPGRSLYPASPSGEFLATRTPSDSPRIPPYGMCQLPEVGGIDPPPEPPPSEPPDDVMARPSHIGALLRQANNKK
jgi:hypothetical protein